MTFEYKGAHPRIPRTKVRRRRGSKPSDPEEKLEDTPVVAELRVAAAKQAVKNDDKKSPKGEDS